MKVFYKHTATQGASYSDETLYEAPRLQKKPPSNSQKIKQCLLRCLQLILFPINIYKISKYALHVFAGKLVVSSQLIPLSKEQLREGKKNLIEGFSGKSLKIKTPDGPVIDGAYLPSSAGKSTGKTILVLGGALQLFELQELKYFFASDEKAKKKLKKENIHYKTSNIHHYLKSGYNVLLFNYRGCGNSEGHTTYEGMKQDIQACISYLQEEKGVKQEDLYLFGHSLGGYFANYFHTKYPKTKVWNDRSFSHMTPLVKTVFPIKCLATPLSKLLKPIGWDLDSLKYWKKEKGEKCVTYHETDELIPDDISLYKKLSDENGVRVITLKKNRKYEEVSVEALKRLSNSLNWGLSDKLLNLMPKLFWGHNRKLTKKEASQVLKTFSPLQESL